MQCVLHEVLHLRGRQAASHIGPQIIEAAPGKRYKPIFHSPGPLINFQKNEAVRTALIKTAPFQASRIAVDPSAVQRCLFVCMDMSQSKIIDPPSPQNRKADITRAPRRLLPVKHYNIKAGGICAQRNQGGSTVFPGQLHTGDRDQTLFPFIKSLPAVAEQEKIGQGTACIGTCICQAVSEIVISAQIVEADLRIRFDD